MSAFPRVIASKNGMQATRAAFDALMQGADGLDAVVQGITGVEDDAEELTVGYGGLPNEEGIVELDAAVMHGPTHRAGAVAGLRNTRHAAKLAQLVMQQTKHVLLVGEGANAFARAHGFPQENLLTEKARRIWLYWKQTHSVKHDWLPPRWEELDPAVRAFFKLVDDHGPGNALNYQRSEAVDRPTGTVHVAAIDARQNVFCSTSTSGLAFKIAGRVGDTPIVGAGLYADNAVGTCGSTGRGEENLRNCSSFAAVELMRQGASPREAGKAVLERVVANVSEPWLLGNDGRPNFGLKLYVLSQSGDYAGVSMWGSTQFAVTDEAGTRLEDCEYLFERDAESSSGG